MDIAPVRITLERRESAKTKILVIDDDACVGAAIQAVLARRRCDTILAARAIAGIHALERYAFDVVMIDIFMPGLNGIDTIRHIRRDSQIPIIAMSGFRLRSSRDVVDYLEMATRSGANLCMHKPFQPMQLIEAIEWSRSLLRPN
jgi:DNA-binding response OmpR family regulator